MEHIFTTQSRGQKLENVLRIKERRDRSQDTEADKSSWEVGKMEDDSCGPCVPSTATICQTTAAAWRKCSALWQTWGGKWTSWLQTQYFHPRIFIIFFFLEIFVLIADTEWINIISTCCNVHLVFLSSVQRGLADNNDTIHPW